MIVRSTVKDKDRTAI